MTTPTSNNRGSENGEFEDLQKWLEQSFAGFMASDPRTHTRASTQMAADYAMKRIEAIIHSEVAQEANKARLEQTIHLQVAEQKFGKVDWQAAIYELEPREKMT